jgi:mannose/fructose/N-acetylgalactosamine-specific phosphotransferase system component IID
MATQDQYAPEKLTKADVVKAWMRWIYNCEISNSYERLQTLSFLAALLPILQKLYKRKEDLSAAMVRHLNFFNTQGIWGGIIHGTVIAMEEQKANGAPIPDAAITGLKTGLIGPFAGIGDTIDWAMWRPLMFSLFLPTLAEGNWIGAVAPFLICVAIFMTEGYFFWMTGYRLGRESIMRVLEGGWINQLITGCGVLGLFMMGALSSQFVKLSTKISWMVGDQTRTLQGILDSIAPGILPLCVVFGIYFFLIKKGPRYTQILLGLMAIAFAGSIFGIF